MFTQILKRVVESMRDAAADVTVVSVAEAVVDSADVPAVKAILAVLLRAVALVAVELVKLAASVKDAAVTLRKTAGASSVDVARTKVVSENHRAVSSQEAFRAARTRKRETHRFTRSQVPVNNAKTAHSARVGCAV